ncbi:hypothetical protein ABIB94_007537 [Bradyrhizobium sp. JR7.2]|uniref:response regulator transcription factor n=1 Tax=Bradyrhizobium TaxID=374 RepID=UPI0024B26CC7|nr:response regulator [Bradyrhizobium barranii]WFU00158.1 response regulator [Bradyrhizobium barranii]
MTTRWFCITRRWLWKTLVTNRIESSSGQAALDMLEARPAVDIVVTDYLMPGMNGLQFAERVRAAARPDLPDPDRLGLRGPEFLGPEIAETAEAVHAARIASGDLRDPE